MSSPARRFQKPLIVALALVGALLLTMLRDGRPGLAFRSAGEAAADATLGSLDDVSGYRPRILSRVIMLVHERYIEPDRIDQRAMLLGGLDYIQRTVAEVLLRHEEGSDRMTIIVNDAQQTFSLADLDRPWALTFRFREIFRFLRANLRDENVNMREIEYAACNGLLHTLDPHSVLLIPELYEEMRLGTRGEFGGLGIVISIRDGQLTIISPIDGTPASRAGLRRMDRIVMIGEETTINMTLEEAVDRLRGPPGTSVSIRVMRRGWSEPRLFEITRAIIRIESVESEMLPGSVGYVKIRSFQGNTHEDLLDHLGRLQRQGMRSLILDLRDDPGGLLDQAVRVADTFLAEGVIVSTAGNDPTEREVRRAHAEGTQPDYPMVVLVNSGSASASEIVAGALKYNNRALILGERTFGKGSVQVLYDFDDGSALKLTIAHYLTPGDISIQSVGIVPDIEVLPLVVRRNRVDLIPDESSLRESNLESHLDGADRPQERAAHQIRHYTVSDGSDGDEAAASPPRPAGPRGAAPSSGDGDAGAGTGDGDAGAGTGEGDAGAGTGDGDAGPAASAPEQPPRSSGPPDEGEERNLLEDFEIQLGHDLLRRSGRVADRATLIARAGAVIASRQEREDARMIEGLRNLGIDWSTGRDRGPTRLAVSAEARAEGDRGAAGEVEAGGQLLLTLRVTNEGDAPVYRLHAVTKSDNPYFDDRELPLGRIEPGQTKSWVQRLRVPRDTQTRVDPVRIEFTELHGHVPEPQEIDVTVRGLERPTFSYALQVVDVDRGNGDGRISRGERVRLFVTVTNQGPGRTYNAQANIKNESGEGVLIHDGRFQLGQMGVGESETHAFEIEVLESFDEAEVELELAITDFELREEVTESLHYPLIDAVEAPAAASGGGRVTARAVVREWPAGDAHEVGWLPENAVVRIGGRQGAWRRVQIGESRWGWVEGSVLSPEDPPAPDAPAPAFEVRMDNTPPEVTISSPTPLAVDAAHLRLAGVVTDADRVLDMYVFVGRHKVFYLSNREGRDPHRMPFDTQLPLEPGSNFILVVARESGDVLARRILVVRREGAAAEVRGTTP